MENEPINLTHKKLLDERLRHIESEISEYTFANLYLFRAIHNYQLIFNQDIYIKGITRNQVPYLMPTSPLEKLDLKDLAKSMAGCECVFPIQKNWLPYFSTEKFESSYMEQESDYLYDVEKMKTFPGRKLSGRRNLLKQFKELYPNHRTEPIDPQNIQPALQVMEHWHSASTKAEGSDDQECKEALFLLEGLNLSGRISYVEGQAAGFLLGEELNPTTYVIHFAKGDTQFKGIYQYLYQEFAAHLSNQYKMINLEQDLGDPDLRHAKRAYMPERLVPKFRLKIL